MRVQACCVALLALLLLSSCTTYYEAQNAYYFVKCGGMGGEHDVYLCTWRAAWRTIKYAATHGEKPATKPPPTKSVPQPQQKEKPCPINRSSF